MNYDQPDGSAIDSNKNGDSGFHIINKIDNVTKQIAKPTGTFTSSYKAEGMAMEKALKHADDQGGERGKILIVTDSLSICERMKKLCEGAKPDWDTEKKIMESISNITGKSNKIVFLWGRATVEWPATIWLTSPQREDALKTSRTSNGASTRQRRL